MANTELPPVPYKTPPVGQDGMLTQPWMAWFRQLFTRVGQNSAPSNSSLFLSPMSAIGDLIFGGIAGAATRLAGNTTTTKKFLTQSGDGSSAASPAWSGIAVTDIPTLNQNTTGTAASFTGNLTGDVTSVGMATTIGAGSIAASKLVGSDIATVGTITTGTWNGTTVAVNKGGTGQTTAGAAFDALSPNTTKGDLTVRNSTTNVRVPIGSDGQVPVADSTQATGLAWKTLQQGSKNYITYNSFENNATTGWSLFNTTLTGVNPTGSITASAASITTFAATSTNPLSGSYSLQSASSAAWSAGQGFITDALTIDREDYKFGRVLTFSARYEIVAGQSNLNLSGGTSNTFAVYIYDVTNSAWIQPSGVYSFMGDGLLKGTFQLPTTCTSVRLAILAVNASGGAVTVNWDDFSLGPQTISYGAPVTDWAAYTPTFVGFGTATNINFTQRRVGDSLEVLGTLTAGTTSGTLTVSLPSGLTTDSSKVSTSVWELVGHGYDSVNVTAAMVMLAKGGNTTVSLGYAGSNGTVPYPSGGDNGANYVLWFRVPITGWSSSLQMSNSTDTRVCLASANTVANSSIANSTLTQFPIGTVTDDTHGAISGNTFICPSPGRYKWSLVGGSDSSVNTGLVRLYCRKNSVQVGTPSVAQSSTITQLYTTVIAESNCKTGDVLDFQIIYTQGSNMNVSGTVIFERVSGPSTIASSEPITAFYKGSSTAIAAGAQTTITYTTKVVDTHGFVNAATGVATINDPGKFRIHGSIQIAQNGAVTAGTQFGPVIRKNSANLSDQTVFAEGTAAMARTCYFSYEDSFVVGDLIDVQFFNGFGVTMTANAKTFLEITRVG